MIKMLHVAVSLTGEGIANYIHNYFTHIDLKTFEIDLVINDSDVNNIYLKSLENIGVNVIKICSYEKSTRIWLNQIKALMRKKQYDILEGHVGIRCNFLCKIAKDNNIPVRIIHTHIAYEPESLGKMVIRKITNLIYSKYVTDYFGCSKDALQWTFGELTKKHRSTVVKNAIDTNKFKFSEGSRNRLRKALNVENDFVVGCVGRLCFQKNQEFLIEIFDKLLKKHENSKLLLIGDGPDRDMLENKISALGIKDKICFLGLRNDVNELLNVFDAFVLPSRYEGFGIVYLEAQINMLPSFGTLERVPQNVAVSNTMHFISENQNPKYWASEIFDKARNGRELSNIIVDEFDVSKQAKILEEKYTELLKTSLCK